MNKHLLLFLLPVTFFLFFMTNLSLAQRQMEKLNRGVVAVRTGTGQVFVSWRLFGTDASDIGFNIYRGSVKLNSTPITDRTNYVDNVTTNETYCVKPVVNGVEQTASESASVWSQFYKEIPLSVPAPGVTPPYSVTNGSTTDNYPSGQSYTYSPNDCSVGDVDGDGEYEIIVKWDPSNSKDNSQGGYTGNVYLDAYKLNGTFLWRIDLGKNIRAGAHYTQFMVYDLDGDGKAEVVCKTAPGTKDGLGNYLTGAASGTDNTADYRTTGSWPGFVTSGPEYLTVFNGQTGAEIQTISYEPSRDPANGWGDAGDNTNRVDRFLACIAYLDGKKPSLVMCRGYYGRSVLVAYDFKNGQLTKRWTFDSNSSGNSAYAGQGYHNLSVGDVDGDGFDEIVYGACTIDHDGKGLYSTGLGHGDAQHLSVLDPSKPGLQSFNVHEDGPMSNGIEMHDAKTGKILWGYPSTGDVGRGLAADVDASHPGYECWAAGYGLYDCKGNLISSTAPVSCNFGIWWDGDDLRELLDGTKLDKYGTGRLVNLNDYGTATACNGTKNTPNLQADILGDWREEVILHSNDNTKLLLFTTTTPTSRRLFTLMHDPVYRMGVARENAGYNQPPQAGFYLGNGMGNPPAPPIQTAKLTWKGDNVANVWDAATTANWINNGTTSSFTQGDTVMFDISGSNNIPVGITGNISPGYVIIESAKDYVFGGSGTLSSTMNLLKAGSGTVTFNTDQTYSGVTKIDEGTLMVNGNLTQSPVTVNWHALLGGTGTIAKNVTLLNGAIINPGTTGGAGTLTFSSGLSLAGAECDFDLSDDPSGSVKANDQIHVSGDISASGPVTFHVNPLNTDLAAGTYNLVTYPGAFSGDIANIAVTGIYGKKYTLTNNGGIIALNIQATRNNERITWGGTGTDWDLLTTPNWILHNQSEVFVTNDTVVFDAAGAMQPLVNVTGPMSVGNMIVETTNTNYSFSGSGSINGNGGITKNGYGTLSLLSKNGYTGKTVVNSGTLETNYFDKAGASSSVGATSSTDPSYFVLKDAVLKHTGASSTTDRGMTLSGSADTIALNATSNPLTLIGPITGPAMLVKTGAGTLTFQGQANTYSGGTIIKGGRLAMADNLSNASGLGTGVLTLDGGTFSMFDNTSTTDYNCPWSINVNTSGTINAASRATLTGSLTGNGNINLYIPFIRTWLNGDWSAFTGKVNVTTDADGGQLRFGKTNYAGMGFNLNSGITATYVSSNGSSDAVANVSIGELSGTAGSFLYNDNWTVGARNTDATFAGIISGNSIIKTGTGTWTLTGANAYAGGTIVNNGTLMVNNTTGSGTGTGTVTVNATGTLAGTGTISGAVTIANGGTISPGNKGIGTLIINNNLLLSSGSNTSVEIKKATVANDSIRISGTLRYSGTLSVTNTGSVAFAAGDNFRIFKAASYSGSFESIIPSTPGTALVWDTTAMRTTGTIGIKAVLQDQTITFDPIAAKTFGDASFTPAASASSGLSVTYTSSNTSVATITGNTITIVGAGTTIITASQAGNSTYAAAGDVQQTLTVAKASQTISFAPLPSKKAGDEPFALTATSSSGLTVTYTSSNPGVATVNGSTVTVVGTGSTTITAQQAGNDNYLAAADVQQVLNVTSTAVITSVAGEIVIAPNPVEDNLIISAGNMQNEYTLQIFSMNGALVYIGKITDKHTVIPMGKYNSGVYMVKIFTRDGVIVRQIVKK